MSLRTRTGTLVLAAALLGLLPRAAHAQPLSDLALEDRITFALNTRQVPRHYDLKVDVVDGITTLMGMVATMEQRAEVERLARRAGAGSIVNHVVVNRDVEQMLADRRSPGYSKGNDPVTDTWVTSQVRGLFMREELVRGGDLIIETVNSVVTVRGRVRSELGRRRALELASGVEGVRRVVDVMWIGR